jgi:NAD(P)-dependent dehydrogenase (short-subunit alcohol dehydrogenase family)
VTAAGGKGIGVVCDLTRRETLDPITAHGVDLCVAAQSPGGRFGARPFLEIEDAELSHGFSVSVQGTWNLLKVVGQHLVAKGAGTFVQIGTSSGMRTKEGFAGLGTTHFALRGLVQVVAKEWRPHGVHVAYLPADGPIESDKSAAWASQIGRGKLLPPAEIARACEYLHHQDPRAWTHELVLRPREGEWSAPT